MPSILQRIAHRGREVPRRNGFSRGLSVPVCCIAVALATPCLAVNSIDGWITTAPAEGDKANPACVTLSANITARIEPLKSLKLALAKTTPAPPKSVSGAIDHLMGHDTVDSETRRQSAKFTEEMKTVNVLNDMLLSQHCAAVDIDRELGRPPKPVETVPANISGQKPKRGPF